MFDRVSSRNGDLETSCQCFTKVVKLVLIVDDVYDLHDSLEELKHFTNAVESLKFKWDVSLVPPLSKLGLDTLPEVAALRESEKGSSVGKT
ncbi:hypothetical protein TIFTF001_026807 [Ficus carica]|uniref:Terpene synthase metal-binding domain-containing protein n=1 Tax=Ficus carica TaxID=3494 RepID=A0AA88DLY4_FICCA|nr:hypothetical protein TIFTF001_026807 [Ficus carica]